MHGFAIIGTAAGIGKMRLDAIDRRILVAVQENCLLGAEALATRSGTTPSTAQRRLRKLRAAGIIRAEVAVLDGGKVGRELLMILAVRLERDDANFAAEFRKRVIAHPAVMQFYLVTGSSDYILHVSAANMGEFENFVETNLISDPRVTMTETNVVIRPLKVGLSVPITT